MTPPLTGIRVLELSRILAGPFACQVLADLGAEVIKIERRKGGDDTRQWGPPFVTDHKGSSWGSAYYHACNRGKSSVSADFDNPEDLNAIKDLVLNADVVVENFKCGGLQKFGLDHQALTALKPDIITCSITGFGQDGPYADRAGYDYIIQGMAGLMDITGDPHGEPQKVGVAVVDLFTGLYAANAIQAALYRKSHTGHGAYIDMALFDCAVAMLANQGMNALISGTPPRRLGNAHPNIAPYQVFEASDGHLIIAVGNDGQFQTLMRVLGHEALAMDERFVTNAQRVKNRIDLTEALNPLIKACETRTLMQKLEAFGVPFGPINRIDQVFEDPQAKARGLVQILSTPSGDCVPSLAGPIIIDGVRQMANTPSPALGAHKPIWQTPIDS
jgi:crotonobetainyl-CoA:carnitine CoA-transferase CaiB-like acyl-CoA transferase